MIRDKKKSIHKECVNPVGNPAKGCAHTRVGDFVVQHHRQGARDVAPTRAWETCPIVEHIEALKGISHTLCAKLIAHIDISRSPTISALWRYAGYGLVGNGDGNMVAEKPTKGEKLHYNKRLKTTVWLITKSFLMSGSPYRELYDLAKEHYTRTHPDWTDGHKHNAALRKMGKIFLSHLWVRWRTLEGLPVSEPYIDRQMDGPHRFGPEHYGWPKLAIEQNRQSEKRSVGNHQQLSKRPNGNP